MRMKKILSAIVAATLAVTSLAIPTMEKVVTPELTAEAVSSGTSIADLPSDYSEACDWIWTNRIEYEGSTKAWNTVFDQIIAGNGTLKYVVKWCSTQTLTYQTRLGIQEFLENSINEWTDWLVGYDEWPFQHVNVEVVGWAVYDSSLLEDLQADETVYTKTVSCDYSWIDTSMRNTNYSLPTTMPIVDNEDMWRANHYADSSYTYGGSYDNRFDMYLECVTGMTDFGGFGGSDCQIFSDNAVISMAAGDQSIYHIFQHEMGHAFGLPDYYGENGANDGPPPNGFPGGGTSIMMAGSSTYITDFDGWFFRYLWTKLKTNEPTRFDLASCSTATTTTTTQATTTTIAPTTTVTTAATTTQPVVTTTTAEDEGIWVIDGVNGANGIELTFSGTAGAIANGVVGYWDNDASEWKTIDWSGTFGSDGTFTTTVEIPTNLDSVQVQKYYAAIWDNSVSDMVNISMNLADYQLLYPATTTTTTQATTTTTTTEAVTTTTTTTTEAATTTEATTTVVEKEQILVGDIVPDMLINGIDLMQAKNFLLTSNTMTNAQIASADVNGDGTFTIADVVLLQKYLMGSETSFPAGAVAEYIPN